MDASFLRNTDLCWALCHLGTGFQTLCTHLARGSPASAWCGGSSHPWSEHELPHRFYHTLQSLPVERDGKTLLENPTEAAKLSLGWTDGPHTPGARRHLQQWASLHISAELLSVSWSVCTSVAEWTWAHPSRCGHYADNIPKGKEAKCLKIRK